MDDPADLRRQVASELERLGLPIETLPGAGLIYGPNGLEQLVARLRGMEPGVTWREVFPDLPRHWEPGRPETWTGSYRPYGPYDYQSLPTGPAIRVTWSIGDASQLDTLLALARSASWPVYGAGIAVTPRPPDSDYLARIVLRRETSMDQLDAFADWVDKQPGFTLAGFDPREDKEYLKPDSTAT